MMRIALFALLLALAGCDSESAREPETATAASPVAVTVAEASQEQWPATYEATGTVRARVSTTISSKWMGYVREVKVQVGDRVRAGQLLITLDARDLDAAANRASAARDEVRNAMPEADSGITAAKAHLDLAEATFKRMNQLFEKKSISDQEFDESNARLKAAQADFAMARARRSELDAKLAQAEQEMRAAEITRSYAEIQSPAAGVVTAKSVDPGNLAAPGAPLLTIEGGGYRLEASVEESKLASIRRGQSVAATMDGMESAIEARVSEIVPSVDAGSRTYLVKIDLPPAPSIRSGIFGRADFTLGNRPVLAVPAAAVMQHGQLESVFVADHETARTRLITAGDRSNDRIEILSGLSAGEKVIVPIPQNLADGARIEVRP
ncbi:MAG TPA: efflux RND transporter periplasmic adaptor subunit [Bryobacteraceae bacterium]|nr:efflux RND transporter periplasmic adaptor subunit [Bryobacteraceae bacterium]